MSIRAYPTQAARDAVAESFLTEEMKDKVTKYENMLLGYHHLHAARHRTDGYALIPCTCYFDPKSERGVTNHEETMALLLAVNDIGMEKLTKFGTFTIIMFAEEPTDENAKKLYQAAVQSNKDKFIEKSQGAKPKYNIKEGTEASDRLPYGQIIIKLMEGDGEAKYYVEWSNFQGEPSNFTPFPNEGIPASLLFEIFDTIPQYIVEEFKDKKILTPEMMLQFGKFLSSLIIHTAKGSLDVTPQVAKVFKIFVDSKVLDNIARGLSVAPTIETKTGKDGKTEPVPTDRLHQTLNGETKELTVLTGTTMNNFFVEFGRLLFSKNDMGKPGQVKQIAGMIPFDDGRYFTDKTISGHECFDPTSPTMGLPTDAEGIVNFGRCAIGTLFMTGAQLYMLLQKQRLTKNALLRLMEKKALVWQSERVAFKGDFEETWGSGVQEGYFLPPGSIEIINKKPIPGLYAMSTYFAWICASLSTNKETEVDKAAMSFLKINPDSVSYDAVDLSVLRADNPSACINAGDHSRVLRALCQCIQDRFNILTEMYTPANKRARTDSSSSSSDNGKA